MALDAHGHLAAATSTGGMTNKLPGRLGDSPLIGCGTYADDRTAAVSCTGHGESFLSAWLPRTMCAPVLAYGGASLESATQAVHEALPPCKARAG